jgi:hypothetical protein
VDPVTGRNYYEQNVCSAAGHTGAFMVDLINRGGVDLAAERRSLERAGGGDDPSYFQGVGRGSTPMNYAADPRASMLPPGQSTAPNTAARAVSVSLENTSRPGQALMSGDQWTLRINGSPESEVLGWGEHNGQGAGESRFGKTDSQGVLVIRGQMKDAEIGQWRQRWTVAGMSAPLSFSVLPRTTAPSSSTPERIMCPQVAKKCADGSVVGYDPAIVDRCVYLPCPEPKKELKKENGGGLDLDIDFGGLAKNPIVWVGLAGAAFLLLGGRR